ncbi:8065_t:CDS:2 [Rhizophagus irregularis]|nr:8065_t:CDS:2 [Rhizophagus irregularis]
MSEKIFLIYEELRKDMETKGIKLHNNVTYDKDINEEAHEGCCFAKSQSKVNRELN